MKTYLSIVLLALSAGSLRLLAGSDDLSDDGGSIPFRHTQELRPPTGTSITVYGGASAFQDGTLEISSPAVPGAVLRGSNDSDVGGVAGIKIGYTWPSFDAIGGSDSADSRQALLQPGVFVDFFWNGFRFRADDETFGSGGSLSADTDSYTLQLEPVLKFNLGAFRPYVGLGVGGSYTVADNAKITVPGLGTGDLTGSSEDLDFSASGIAGVEYFFAQHWALMAEYKYVYIVDPTFHGNIGGADIRYHVRDGLGSHLFTAGVSYYF